MKSISNCCSCASAFATTDRQRRLIRCTESTALLRRERHKRRRFARRDCRVSRTLQSSPCAWRTAGDAHAPPVRKLPFSCNHETILTAAGLGAGSTERCVLSTRANVRHSRVTRSLHATHCTIAHLSSHRTHHRERAARDYDPNPFQPRTRDEYADSRRHAARIFSRVCLF